MTTSHENPLATVTVNSLRIDVWYAEDRRDEDGRTRRADGYRYAMANPGADPESLRLFPMWVGEAAYLNEDELAILTLDSSDVSMDRRANLPDQPPYPGSRSQTRPAAPRLSGD